MNIKSMLGWGAVVLVLLAVIFGVYKFSSSNEKVVADSAGAESVSVDENVLGSVDARIVFVEYADFQCPACKAYSDPVKRLKAELGDEMVLVYRHFPLMQIHKHAREAAIASEAAANQGMFWAYSDLLYANQEVWSSEGDPTPLFEEYAQELELDVDKFRADMDSEEISNRIQEDIDSGFEAGVGGTPSFFVNGVKIPTPRSYEDMKRVVLSAAEE